jgi:RNA polymerase sigma factor (sigma-70 family)
MLRYGSGLTQSEIAREVGISQMHVSRRLRACIDQLRVAAA